MMNGEDLVRKFEGLKRKDEQLKSEKIVLETKISSKKEELDSLEKDIFKNFKVKTIKEARELLAKCKSKLVEKLEELEGKMSPFEDITQTNFEGEEHEEAPF